MGKRLAAVILAVALPLGAVTARAVTAGSEYDPLVSLSYVTGTYADEAVRDAGDAFDSSLSGVTNGLKAPSVTGVAVTWRLDAGSLVTLRTGDSVTLYAGEATLDIHSGAVVNVTLGREFDGGDMRAYVRYLCCEDCAATVKAARGAVVAVNSGASVYNAARVDEPFTDVKWTKWYAVDVMTATALELMDGTAAGKFSPEAELTLAEAVRLVCRVYQLHRFGAVKTTDGETDPWFWAYEAYARETGLITQYYTDNVMQQPVTRADFAAILYRALNPGEYPVTFDVPDGAITDVPADAVYAPAVYAFYRAGILTGYTKTDGVVSGAFLPEDTITRAEAAAAAVRLYAPGMRPSA